MFIVELVNDGRPVGTFTVAYANGEATCSGPGCTVFMHKHKGALQSYTTLPEATALAQDWGLPDTMPQPGRTYFPRDGLKFLIAVYSTYIRSHRYRAYAWKDGQPPAQSQHPQRSRSNTPCPPRASE